MPLRTAAIKCSCRLARLEEADKAWGSEVIAAALDHGHLRVGGVPFAKAPRDDDYDDDRHLDYDGDLHDYLMEEEDLAERAAEASHVRHVLPWHAKAAKVPIKDASGQLVILRPKLKVSARKGQVLHYAQLIHVVSHREARS